MTRLMVRIQGAAGRMAMAALCGVLWVPAVALAQEASVAGSVTDTTGSVLPGVTVEVTSPALIEKSRVAVTDGSGRYRVTNLPPGQYVVKFTLPGFTTVDRPGIQLSGSFAATVNAELPVGALEDTITVTGESPLIDAQNVAQQRVMNREILDLIPVGRTAHDVGILLPGVTMAQGGTDVGGTGSPAITYSLASHGSRRQDQAITQGGMRITGLSREGYSIQGPVNNVATFRTRLNVDLYNALNADTILGVNQNFATWGNPTSVLAARVGRLSLQFDF